MGWVSGKLSFCTKGSYSYLQGISMKVLCRNVFSLKMGLNTEYGLHKFSTFLFNAGQQPPEKIYRSRPSLN